MNKKMESKPYQNPHIETLEVDLEAGISTSLTSVNDYVIYDGDSWETM